MHFSGHSRAGVGGGAEDGKKQEGSGQCGLEGLGGRTKLRSTILKPWKNYETS